MLLTLETVMQRLLWKGKGISLEDNVMQTLYSI